MEAKQIPEVETVVHLVVASSDTRHGVASAADLELKSKQRLVKELESSPVHLVPHARRLTFLTRCMINY